MAPRQSPSLWTECQTSNVMNNYRYTFALVALLATSGLSASGQDVLIQGGTLLTITQGTLPNTDVLVQNGRITRVGEGLTAPDGVQVIDASGKYVMPGIIDAHSHIALSSVNESSAPVTAEVTMEDVVNPYDVSIYRALAGGVTTAHLMHGSANVIGGQNETVKLRYGSLDPDELRFQGAPRTIKFALGENPTRVHGQRGANGSRPALRPSSRMGVEAVLRETFAAAKRYMEAQDAFESARRSNPKASGPAYDQRLEVMADILRGEILVHCHSYRADEILMLMRVLGDFGVDKITFQHANEAFKVAPELAAFGANASIFADWWSYKFEVYYSTAYNAAILTRNGVTTSINSDSGELNRHLYHEAAKAQRYGGLTDNESLRLITINPAIQLGIDERVGSIEVGKDGDLAIYDGHPLSVYAIPLMTFIDGRKYFDRAMDDDDMRLNVDVTSDIQTGTLTEQSFDHN